MSKANITIFATLMISTLILTVVLTIIFSLFSMVFQYKSKLGLSVIGFNYKSKLNRYDILNITTSLFAVSLASTCTSILEFNFHSARIATMFIAAPFVNIMLPDMLTWVLPTKVVIQTKPGQNVSQEEAENQISMTQNRKLKDLNITASLINIGLIIAIMLIIINFLITHPDIKGLFSIISF